MVENLSKDDNQYLSQEFDNDVLDLVTQKVFYLYEYMSDFEKFKEELPHKGKLYSSLTDRKIAKKEYDHALNVWAKFEMKTMKDYRDLYLECDVLLLPDGFEIELTPDPDMYIFFEKGTRGGISYIFNSYRGAFKKYVRWGGEGGIFEMGTKTNRERGKS